MVDEHDDLRLSPAAEALAELLARREAGEEVDFEQFCRDHAAVQDELRRLYGRWRALRDAFVADRGTDRGAPPRAIGPFRVTGVLGHGGMGVVYDATRRAPPHERVAVKVVRDGATGHRLLARFRAEQAVLRALDHDGIARIVDAGSDAGGRAWFAMEWIDGRPITAAVSGSGLADRIELFAATCDAVQHAHDRGVVHRDLKPANILVAARRGRLRPVVIDFGLSLPQEGGALSRSFRTTRGVVLGTPEYMSPEQAAAGALSVDARTDVYSLGVVLYELVCGVHPFVDPEGTGPIELLRRIVREPPRAPSARDPVLASFDPVVLEALAKDPAGRQRSAAALGAAARSALP